MTEKLWPSLPLIDQSLDTYLYSGVGRCFSVGVLQIPVDQCDQANRFNTVSILDSLIDYLQKLSSSFVQMVY